ncbi:Hypothetical protein SRAE_2000474150 [Strongyloides ratti]|uniref:7TM GPCR, serpentine receptor class e (Sre) family-containing protein n=1 Tax=Strongyloides ratti TaxID=34506 RepID=A0A090LJX5_STRRB|nr:Hypothetical protein SRAE_2000474150 [Strongyloides ratti]CEF70102.1 Hypothetical protein SRAE_2000474150 [Strongyloides ratti]
MGISNNSLIVYGYLSLVCCFINIILLPFTFRMLFFKRVWHVYFRISVSLIVICSVIISLNAGIVSYLFIYFNLDISNKFNQNMTEEKYMYNFFRSLQPSTNDSYRYTMWVLCGERLLATIKFKNYQTNKAKLFALLTTLFVIMTTLFTKFLIELLKIQKYMNYIYTLMDIPLILIILILLILNCKRKKTALIKGADLSSKFQLNENYFLILFSLPIITFNVFQLFIVNILAIKVNIFNMNHNELFMIVYAFRIIAYILFQVYFYFNKYIFIFIKSKFERKVIPIQITSGKQKSLNNSQCNEQKNKADIEKNIYFKMLEKDLNQVNAS